MSAKLYASLAEAIQELQMRGFTCFLRRGSVARVPPSDSEHSSCLAVSRESLRSCYT
jgi:hypothetical protein